MDYEKGLAILNIARCYRSIGIGFRELQRLTRFANGTIIRWSKLLQASNIIFRDSRGKIYLNENISNNFEKDLLLSRYGSVRQGHNKKSTYGRRKIDALKQRRDAAYYMISTVAAIGNSSWRRTNDHKYGLVSMIDLQTGADINFISKPLPGIGISDFHKNEKEGVPSMLDTRTFVDYNERFSYLNLSDQEVQRCIRDLYENDPPILKEVEIVDHKFLCFVDDPNQKDSIRLEQENLHVYNQNTIKLTLNTDDDGRSLPTILEVNCDSNYPTSRILVNVNDKKIRKYLELDTFCKESNNFSESIWGERRYIIVDPMLKEFIQICNLMCEAVNRKMEMLYCRSLLSKEGKREYLKWYHNNYGVNRRGAEILNLNRISINRIKKNIKMVSKVKNTEERNRLIEELDYVCRYRTWGPYEKIGIPWAERVFTLKDLEDIKHKLKQLYKESKQIFSILDSQIDKYHGQVESQKFEDITQKYGIVISPLRRISYPDFLRKQPRIVIRQTS